MRMHWISAILVSSALAVGCGDRGNQNAQNFEENKAAPAATAPADQDQATREAVSPNADTATSEGTRPTTGSRTTSRAQAERRETRNRSLTNAPASPAEPRTERSTGSASSSAAAPRDEFREVTVPSGTALPLELLTALSSDSAQVETPVRARVREGVLVNGYTAIPAGSIVTGSVTEVEQAGRVKGRARLAFRFNEIEAQGERERISTNPLSYEAEATKGEDATKIGAGAGIGAAIGGILGGGKGAVKGGAIGGAAGTGVVLATKGKDVNLAAGTDLAATLAEALTVRVPVR